MNGCAVKVVHPSAPWGEHCRQCRRESLGTPEPARLRVVGMHDGGPQSPKRLGTSTGVAASRRGAIDRVSAAGESGRYQAPPARRSRARERTYRRPRRPSAANAHSWGPTNSVKLRSVVVTWTSCTLSSPPSRDATCWQDPAAGPRATGPPPPCAGTTASRQSAGLGPGAGSEGGRAEPALDGQCGDRIRWHCLG
jgi:hypothetical protein